MLAKMGSIHENPVTYPELYRSNFVLMEVILLYYSRTVVLDSNWLHQYNAPCDHVTMLEPFPPAFAFLDVLLLGLRCVSNRGGIRLYLVQKSRHFSWCRSEGT
jgi:hypothetical protein